MRYRIVFFPSKARERIAQDLRGFLDSEGGIEVDGDAAEFIFIVGGDGSFFHFAKAYAFQEKKLVGIQAGNIAFSLNFKPKDLGCLENQQWKTMEFLEVKNGENRHLAMNDVYVSGKLFMESDIYINGVFLERFRGSGLLFSTKCGSTGMNKSVGGPILINDGLWLFNELGTCNTSINRSLVVPLVLSEDNDVSIRSVRNKNFHMYIDGQKVRCSGKKNLYISMIKGRAKVLRIEVGDYINKIRDIFLV